MTLYVLMCHSPSHSTDVLLAVKQVLSIAVLGLRHRRFDTMTEGVMGVFINLVTQGVTGARCDGCD